MVDRAINICQPHQKTHIFLRKNTTIKSLDGGKEGHFCNCVGMSAHLQLTRSGTLVGQFYLSKLTK